MKILEGLLNPHPEGQLVGWIAVQSCARHLFYCCFSNSVDGSMSQISINSAFPMHINSAPERQTREWAEPSHTLFKGGGSALESALRMAGRLFS